MRSQHQSARRLTQNGFTFMEIIIALLILGIALVTMSGVISRDMTNGTRNSWDEIGQAAAARLTERYAYYEGFNSLDLERQNNLLTMPITVTQPTDLPDLANVPWAQTRRYIERSNGNPEVLRLTVVVNIANSVAEGTAGKFRSWHIVTLVPKNGFDKSL